ncbi:NAD(P)-dependent oxidoreductase [Micromonospora sp. NPDC000089]|uniref:NAD(P)-dependent oxidoreductase n=1 Tax=unclassified Micromonospora TaxID=2617518 RepID=UPI0036950392
MRLLLLGASGPTGRILLGKALEGGHHVTVLVRRTGAVRQWNSRVTEVTGDATDETALRDVIPGNDAVLSTLGPGKSFRSEIVSEAAAALVPAMSQSGVSRLIFLSAFGAGDTPSYASLPQRLLYGTLLRKVLADKTVADRRLLQSGLDVTLVYPVLLSNGPAEGYSVGTDLRFRGLPRISRADAANFMLAQLTDRTWSGRRVILAPPVDVSAALGA